MNAAQNDSEFRRASVAQAFAGFEVAVAEYERGQSALDEARYQLNRATAQLDYARVCLDEIEAELDVVVMQFNMSNPDAPDYYALMAELDLASDKMLRDTEKYEKALAQHQFATARFESERASSREYSNIACALRGELSRSLQEVGMQQASNDPHYFSEQALDELSDAAYRFYRRSA